MSPLRICRRLGTPAVLLGVIAAALLAGCDRPRRDGATTADSNAPIVAATHRPTDTSLADLIPETDVIPRATPTAPVTSEVAVPEPDSSTVEPVAQTKLKEFRTRFDQAITTNPAPAVRAEAWGLLGMAYFAYEFPAAAAACFTNAVFHTPADHRAWYGLAECRFEEDDFAGAVTAMQTALQQMQGATNATRADQNSARRFLGDSLERLGRVPEAIEQFQIVLQSEPRDLYSLVKAGQLHSLSGGGLGAVHFLESALKRAPKNQTIRSLLAQEYRRSGMTNAPPPTATPLDQGTPQASPVVRPDPWRRAAAGLVESPTVFVRRGNQFARRGQPLRAIAAYESALRLEPTNNTAAINLTSALLSTRRADDARRVVEEVAARGDNSEELRYNLALARVATGATNEAMAVVQQWRRDRPDEPLALQLEATIREKSGDLSGAQRALEQYLALKPGAAPMAVRLARLQARTGNPAAARSTLQTALDQSPGNPPLQYELARLLALNPRAEIRDPARAVELMRPLMSARPGLPQLETMILALHAAGDKDAAAERFQRLTNSMAKRTNAVVVARLERLGAALASPTPVQEPWPFALNARTPDPEDAATDDAPAKTP
jgi:tetratricopeptide (TPR) repeat protein